MGNTEAEDWHRFVGRTKARLRSRPLHGKSNVVAILKSGGVEEFVTFYFRGDAYVAVV
jgi:hypothetical protein